MKVNRELIDTDFEGYKLSLDTIPTYSTQFPAPLQIPTPADEQVSTFFKSPVIFYQLSIRSS